MRCIGLGALICLILTQLSCQRVGSFEVVFEGPTQDQMGLGLIDMPGLSARGTGSMKGCSIWLDTQTEGHTSTEQSEFGEIHLTASDSDDPWVAPWDWIVSDQISSNGLRLSARDLRAGQRIRVTYSLKKKYRDSAKVEVLNYLKPPKVLRLSISTILEGNFKKMISSDAVEAIVITALSWHLPSDIALVKSTESTAGLTVMGDVKATYKLVQSETGLMFRRYEFYESLDIDTKLADKTVSTNWAELRIAGGTHPGNTSDVNDISSTPVLPQIPSLEVHPASPKK